MSLTVLVTGASGFVGAPLARALVEQGHTVRAMTRRPEAYAGAGEPVHGDVRDPSTLAEALDGVDVAYYLVHSLDAADFTALDAAAARGFAVAAAEAGSVRQIVYLGGLGADEDDLSPHLRSRREVEGLLEGTGVPVTALRAAIVVGHGGVSWEMTRELAASLPLLVSPPWAATRTQPIALEDVVRYLVGVLDREDAFGRAFDVGGAEVLTYEDMLRRAAALQNGWDVPSVRVPLPSNPITDALATKASSLSLAALTGVDEAVARHLVASMDNEVVVRDEAIRELVPFEPMGYDAMVQAAIAERLRAGDPV